MPPNQGAVEAVKDADPDAFLGSADGRALRDTAAVEIDGNNLRSRHIDPPSAQVTAVAIADVSMFPSRG
jgi:hypothetical protein